MTTDVIVGDCRNKIKDLDNSSIDCIMTSPPYWGLRDYGHEDQIGLEPTPEEYLKNMLDVFDLVKPKLKDTGNCFVNIGDTYARSGSKDTYDDIKVKGRMHVHRNEGVPPKCMCMIPERFALGMIEHGWILRNKIVWHKPNHMPESVTDRLTKSYEIIYHFVKRQKYYYDLDAIREPHTTKENRPAGIVRSRTFGYGGKHEGNKMHEDYGSPRARTQRNVDKIAKHFIKRGSGGNGNLPSFADGVGKNPGDVWQINTKPYTKAHFAVFPIELVKRPILAGCPIGGMVLDPFGGSGTVAEFCRKNERNCTIIELNPDYEHFIIERSMANTPDITKWSNE